MSADGKGFADALREALGINPRANPFGCWAWLAAVTVGCVALSAWTRVVPVYLLTAFVVAMVAFYATETRNSWRRFSPPPGMEFSALEDPLGIRADPARVPEAPRSVDFDNFLTTTVQGRRVVSFDAISEELVRTRVLWVETTAETTAQAEKDVSAKEGQPLRERVETKGEPLPDVVLERVLANGILSLHGLHVGSGWVRTTLGRTKPKDALTLLASTAPALCEIADVLEGQWDRAIEPPTYPQWAQPTWVEETDDA